MPGLLFQKEAVKLGSAITKNFVIPFLYKVLHNGANLRILVVV
jgi:hypothetical protein